MPKDLPKFKKSQIGTHPCKDKSRWLRHMRPHETFQKLLLEHTCCWIVGSEHTSRFVKYFHQKAITTYAQHKRFNYWRLSLRLKDFPHEMNSSTLQAWFSRQKKRFMAKLRTIRQRELPGPPTLPETSSWDLQFFASDGIRAATYLMTMSQKELFEGTTSPLLKTINLEKGDKLLSLTTVLYNDGLWSLGWVLNMVPLIYSVKHTLILQNRGNIAKLLITKAHHYSQYQGVEHLMAHLQQTSLVIWLPEVLKSLGKCWLLWRWWRKRETKDR